MTDLEVGLFAGNAADRDRLMTALDAFELVDVKPGHFTRAKQVQRLLARQGLKGRKVPDLVIAAVGEESSRTVLHYDADFDHIASVTGQPAEWVVPQGTVG